MNIEANERALLWFIISVVAICVLLRTAAGEPEPEPITCPPFDGVTFEVKLAGGERTIDMRRDDI